MPTKHYDAPLRPLPLVSPDATLGPGWWLRTKDGWWLGLSQLTGELLYASESVPEGLALVRVGW